MQREYWFVITAAILYGTITVGGQFFANLGLSLYEISFYPYLFITILLLSAVLLRPEYGIKKEMLPFFLIYGLIGALVNLAQYAGIVLGVPVAVVAFLMYTQPVWTLVFGKIMLSEGVTFRKIVAVAVALAGVILLIRPGNIGAIGPIAGIISALLAGVFLSLWVVFGRKGSTLGQHYITTTFGFFVFTCAWLLLIWPVAALFIHEPNIIRLSAGFQLQYWLYLLIFCIISLGIPIPLFYRGVRKIPASIAGILLLLEPVSATILAAFLFGQAIGLNVLSGGALILLSNYVVIQKNI